MAAEGVAKGVEGGGNMAWVEGMKGRQEEGVVEPPVMPVTPPHR